MLNFLKRRPPIAAAMKNLSQYAVPDGVRARFVHYLENAKDRELYHVNPRLIAERLGTNERATLKLLLAAVHEGIMKMHWEVSCPACGAVGHTGDELRALHHNATCAACQNVFPQRLDNDVRVTFSLHPRLRQLPPAADDLNFRAEVDGRLGPVTGQAVLLMPEFQQLFPQDKLLPDESLEVARTALIFTDLAGSTALYAARGDPRAYHLVRLHFDVLFAVSDQNGGLVVKNIGDAIMAAFETPLDALRAAFAMQTGIAELNRAQQLADAERLILKIGLHSGPCLSVTLNDRPDYFGTTVNVAARVQGLSHGNDLVFTDLIRAGAGELLAGRSVEKIAATIKGIGGNLQVHRVAMA